MLKDNMKELAEDLRDLVIVDENDKPLQGDDEERRYFEDPWLFKKGDTYYFTYSTGTTHHSILEYHGKWWLFYHDCERSGGINEKRNVKFRELKFDDKGGIIKMDGSDK